MKTTFTLAFALFIFFNTVAQQTFQKVINTGATSNSLPPSIKPTLDGGFIYSWSYSRLLTDNTTVHETSFGKFKRAGEVQWTRLLPGMDEPVAIQLEDSSFILSSSSYEIQIIKCIDNFVVRLFFWGQFREEHYKFSTVASPGR